MNSGKGAGLPGGPAERCWSVICQGPKLMIFPGGGGGGGNQKSTQGNFFDGICDPLDKYVEHDIARPSVIKKPNENIGEINRKLGFLLSFGMDEGIAEALARVFPKKACKEEDACLPLWLERVEDAREQYRVTFRVFPRDLIEERGKNSMKRGLKFMPPYALHQGSENQNTFSRLLILLNQRFREDEKPKEDKLKREKLKSSIDKRIEERKRHQTDEKMKSVFSDRVSAKKRKEES